MGQFLSTPSARRATTAAFSMTTMSRFLSTPSARRATYAKVWNEWFRDISIHALLMQTGVKRVISIHALREEGDRARNT